MRYVYSMSLEWKESNGPNRKQGDTETSKLCFLFSNQFFYSDINNYSLLIENYLKCLRLFTSTSRDRYKILMKRINSMLPIYALKIHLNDTS